jgi:hypothetical protein
MVLELYTLNYLYDNYCNKKYNMNNLTDQNKKEIVLGQLIIAGIETILYLIALRNVVKAGGTPNQLTFKMLLALCSPTVYILMSGLGGCETKNKTVPVMKIQN